MIIIYDSDAADKALCCVALWHCVHFAAVLQLALRDVCSGACRALCVEPAVAACCVWVACALPGCGCFACEWRDCSFPGPRSGVCSAAFVHHCIGWASPGSEGIGARLDSSGTTAECACCVGACLVAVLLCLCPSQVVPVELKMAVLIYCR